MHRLFVPCLVATAVLAPSVAARAADLPVVRKAAAENSRAAPVAPFHDWSGGYGGLQIGYGFGSSTGTQNSGGTFFPVVPYTIDPHGFLGGGHLGYNRQVGQWIFGVEGDIEAAHVNGLSAFSFAGQTFFFNANADMLASVRGRIGVARNDWLFYATGGAAWGDVATPPLDALSGTRTGWTVGTGIEHAFDPRWSTRFEYRYTDLGSIRAQGGEPGSFDDNTFHFHAVRVGVSYKFGSPW